ncbi:MAG TPA: class I SAM-dependent methyltransferase [Sandaracinaceae bacterium LLY-WYZ-13_1]|nr:class I SAM-dependent methyltransferase [Sandaracinaceae bacterium LLY-WYZ-13_1]
MSEAKRIREAARETGGRTLEIIADTPEMNAWYYSKFAARIRGDVLELGSGIGNLSRYLARDARRLVVTDVEDDYLARLEGELGHHAHVRVARYDLEGPPPGPIRDDRFDVVISLNVLEHVRDDARAVRDLVGLLRPGGWLLTYVPAVPFAFGTMDEALGHHRRYGRRELRARMEEAGLGVRHLAYMNVLGLLGWLVNGRLVRRRTLDPVQVRAFERLVPLVRLEDRLRVPIGLGLVCHAQKR